ncbi:hypothetical protein HK098_006184 [Nowakowskiella sp. JEL0407]|nr:hypothetical protein HK098_006184 [Nowakowskiella sp. JEL0407]
MEHHSSAQSQEFIENLKSLQLSDLKKRLPSTFLSQIPKPHSNSKWTRHQQSIHSHLISITDEFFSNVLFTHPKECGWFNENGTMEGIRVCVDDGDIFARTGKSLFVQNWSGVCNSSHEGWDNEDDVAVEKGDVWNDWKHRRIQELVVTDLKGLSVSDLDNRMSLSMDLIHEVFSGYLTSELAIISKELADGYTVAANEFIAKKIIESNEDREKDWTHHWKNIKATINRERYSFKLLSRMYPMCWGFGEKVNGVPVFSAGVNDLYYMERDTTDFKIECIKYSEFKYTLAIATFHLLRLLDSACLNPKYPKLIASGNNGRILEPFRISINDNTFLYFCPYLQIDCLVDQGPKFTNLVESSDCIYLCALVPKDNGSIILPIDRLRPLEPGTFLLKENKELPKTKEVKKRRTVKFADEEEEEEMGKRFKFTQNHLSAKAPGQIFRQLEE